MLMLLITVILLSAQQSALTKALTQFGQSLRKCCILVLHKQNQGSAHYAEKFAVILSWHGVALSLSRKKVAWVRSGQEPKVASDQRRVPLPFLRIFPLIFVVKKEIVAAQIREPTHCCRD